jgi:hypothetical protein
MVPEPEDPDEDPPDDLPPLPCAAKTESWMVCFALAHFGQAIAVFCFITRRSYCAPQSSQTYS